MIFKMVWKFFVRVLQSRAETVSGAVPVWPELGGFRLFFRFAQDAFSAAGIYIVFVGFTLLLKRFTETLSNMWFPYLVARILEGSILISGAAIALLMVICVTTLTATHLIRSLCLAIGLQSDGVHKTQPKADAVQEAHLCIASQYQQDEPDGHVPR